MSGHRGVLLGASPPGCGRGGARHDGAPERSFFALRRTASRAGGPGGPGPGPFETGSPAALGAEPRTLARPVSTPPHRRRRRPALLVCLAAVPLLTACLGAPPQIVQLEPVNGSSSVAVDAPVTVHLDQAVRRDTVRARLSVDPPIPHCSDLFAAFTAPPSAPCFVRWAADSQSFQLLHPGALFAPDTQYTFLISPGIESTGGSVNSLDHRWKLRTAAAPRVTSISPDQGARNVTIDTTPVVTFSAPMDAAATAAAIRLSPEVPGTRIVRNAEAHGRFVVLPGRLLQPRTEYTLSVGPPATDEHGAALGSQGALTVRFTTGGLGTAAHTLVLARRPGEPPSQVLLGGLGALQPGEPAPAATVLSSPLCGDAAGCGAVPPGAPTLAYLEGTVSPDGRALAVVQRDRTTADAAPELHLVSLLSGDDSLVAAGATHPSWRPDGRLLAYAGQGGVHVLDRTTARDTLLPPGDPLAGAPAWSADGSTLALPVQAPDGTGHIDLADPALDLRYPAPGAGDVGSPALSPDGGVLAVYREGAPRVAGTWLIRLRSSDPRPSLLGGDLVPVAWTDAGTLLAREYSGDPGLVRVDTGSGDRFRLHAGPPGPDLGSAVASPGGHQVAYLATGPDGSVQALIENADGSNPAPLTAFAPGDLEAASVSFGG